MNAGFAQIAAVLKARSGLAIGPDKLYLLETRLAPLMAREGAASLAELAAKMRPNSALERDVVEAMTTNESLFFRDGKPFDTLRVLLPRLHAARPAGAKLRIWSAAASTGQEPYSIAMVVRDIAALKDRAVEILATDLSREALQRARDGIYTQFEIQRGLPVQMLLKHFEKTGAQWRVRETLRALVTFRELNLLDDLRPLGQFDIVFCRNVLIYFDAPTKARVLEAMTRQMAADAALFLGGAETVLGLCDRLRPIEGQKAGYSFGGSCAAAA